MHSRRSKSSNACTDDFADMNSALMIQATSSKTNWQCQSVNFILFINIISFSFFATSSVSLTLTNKLSWWQEDVCERLCFCEMQWWRKQYKLIRDCESQESLFNSHLWVLWAYHSAHSDLSQNIEFVFYEILLFNHKDTVQTECLIEFAEVKKNWKLWVCFTLMLKQVIQDQTNEDYCWQ